MPDVLHAILVRTLNLHVRPSAVVYVIKAAHGFYSIRLPDAEEVRTTGKHRPGPVNSRLSLLANTAGKWQHSASEGIGSAGTLGFICSVRTNLCPTARPYKPGRADGLAALKGNRRSVP